MKDKDFKKIIPKWAKEVGELEAKLILINAGLGYTTALFLIKGTYKSELKGRLILILTGALSDYLKKAS
jgi:hypothetical protein